MAQVTSLKGKITLVGQTDTGRVREHNEDTIATDPDVGLLVLADATPAKSPAASPSRPSPIWFAKA